MLLPVLPNVLPRFVSVERFAHVKGIFALALILAGGVVTVVVDDATEHAVVHVAVHGYGGVVACYCS